ncbi:Crp/Fnr family transcriptional regulator [Sphingobacterium suaedae]|uniref:Crp/Fnr family transcriptional regulator n=1 Tax=Sphingobacterium suaedae TaxID=1686402 RepID=A0ABW5KGB0_9SPHI
MKKKLKTCDHSCFMCQHVLHDWYTQVDRNRTVVKIRKGQQFISEGDTVRGVYFVLSGAIKVHRRWGDKEMIVRFAKKGDIVGHRGVTSGKGAYPISATALEATELCFLDLDFFMLSLRLHASLSYQLMLFYADELQWSEQKMYNAAHLSVKSRLAYSLLLLRGLFGREEPDGFIGLILSKTDLAAYIGTTYETVYRAMGELEVEGLIALAGKKIFVCRPDLLQALLEKC